MHVATERKLIDECLARLDTLPDMALHYSSAQEGGGSFDTLHLKGAWGQATLQVRLLARITPDALALIQHQLGETISNALLFCGYVGPKQAHQLKTLGLQFIDTLGNTWINRPPLYVEISGRRGMKPSSRPSRAFTTAGLKLIHALLQHPHNIQKNYRTLATEAGIALGAVGGILQELKQQGYLEQKGTRRRTLLKSEALLYRWQLGYLEQLRPRLILEKCRLSDTMSLTEMVQNFRRMATNKPLVGGAMGTALLLGHHDFSQVSLHIDPSQLLRTMLQLRLTPDPEGEVILLRHFGTNNGWTGWQPEHVTLADPLLLHGELAAHQLTTTPDAVQLMETVLLPRLHSEDIRF